MQRPSLRPRPKYGRLGVTRMAAAATLVILLIAGWLLDRRSTNSAETRVVELARNADTDPVELIASAARGNRIVMLSDIHTSAATKRLAARAIERIVATSGLDLLVLEVSADQQPVIDQYLHQPQENAALLMSNGRTIREPGPATRQYLDIYRTVWRLNQKLGADQRIRIVAADLPGWPPARSIGPAELARKSAEREAHMQKRIQDVISLNPGARILVFMTGFHVLKSGMGELQTGGTTPVQIAWLGGRLAGIAPEEVYSILVDAPASGSTPDVTAYSGTMLASILQRGGVNKSFGISITDEFDAIRQPLVMRKSPGLSFEITPRDYTLGEVADAYIRIN